MSVIRLNGTENPLIAGTTLIQLVAQIIGRELQPNGNPIDGSRLGVAVAHNAGVVPRSQWSETMVKHGDDVEIVTAVQGG